MTRTGHDTSAETLRTGDSCDVIVLGSGAAGLTAALTAGWQGLRVMVLESQAVIGGTSARSSGTIWVPDSSLLRAKGVTGDRGAAETYLAHLVDTAGPAAPWRRFLEAAPHMLDEVMTRTNLRFSPLMAAADYRQDLPGAASDGRALEPLPFDGRKLGEDFTRLAPPLKDLMVFGGMMVTRAEAARLLRFDRSLASLKLALSLTLRFLLDRLRHARGTRLVLGNALIAALMDACRRCDISIVTGVQVTSLTHDDKGISGVRLIHQGRTLTLTARRGVVLAGGGFPASPDKRREHLPQPTPPATPAAPGCVGSTLDLALEAGATLGPDLGDNGLWFPSSLRKGPDGETIVYPHIALDRSKPGLIAVNGRGKRFANEAISYHEFVRAMYADCARGHEAVPAWLIVDHRFLKRYGLGAVRPRALSLKAPLASGYLLRDDTLAGLARTIDVPPAALQETIDWYNRFAANGTDPEFHKGETAYDRGNGDPSHRPNPCVAPIVHAPFYAMAVWPTPLGTSRGLLTDAHSRVLDGAGQAIGNLYACGNDVQSAFAGHYPGAGAQLAQAMTFGWLAGRHAAGQPFPTFETASPDARSPHSETSVKART